eukprot:Nitzschia sp. Nitz4//scaffold332_size19022//5232//7076//NITZ4_008739-RA/size19022-processed-gene-0.18-mRNA-1//1//CDS//3329548198//7092//frame0
MVKPRAPSQHGHPTTTSRRHPTGPLDAPFRGSTSSAHNNRKIPEKYRKRQQQERALVVYIGILAAILLGGIGFLIYLIQTDPINNHHLQNQQKTLAQRVSDAVQQSSNTIRRRPTSLDDLQTAMWEQLETLEVSMQNNQRFPNEQFQSLPRFHRLLPALSPKEPQNPLLTATERSRISKFSMHGPYFRVSRMAGTLSDRGSTPMAWEQEWEQIQEAKRRDVKLAMDYTLHEHYQYPSVSLTPPKKGYPNLRPLRELFSDWPQDELDSPPLPLVETLQHFDFRDPEQLAIAELYRQHEVPFKLTNVPELIHANQKWTDEYVSQGFDALRPQQQRPSHADIPANGVHPNQVPPQGKCQEAPHNYFAFFQPTAWNVEKMGIPPTRNNDWTFWKWSQHARYADAVQLDASKPHFYWQAGVPKEEREVTTHHQQTSTDDEYPNPRASFISRDLFPAFSSPNATFICPDPTQQKGIQCRFGERGVVAAVHYDSGKNMVGMIEGAKRYVLLPPNQCRHLGIVTLRQSPIFRHSILNLGHVVDPPRGEQQEWLQRAGGSLAVETVLKAGEVLSIPSHWFHYIIGLQKNAQCNVRSGVDTQGSKEFGGANDVLEPMCDPRSDP